MQAEGRRAKCQSAALAPVSQSRNATYGKACQQRVECRCAPQLALEPPKSQRPSTGWWGQRLHGSRRPTRTAPGQVAF